MLNSNERIFIRGVNWIGDAVMTIPAINSLRMAFRDAEISILLKPSVAPLFEKNPHIDDILIYEDRFKGIIGKINLANFLKSQSFSRAFLFQNAFDAALLAFLAGIPERTGYNRDGRGFMLTKPVKFSGEDRVIHHIDYYLNLLRSAGIQAEYSKPYIFQSIDERIEARKLISILRSPILGINPGAAYGSAKRWLPERFAEVAVKFIKENNGSVVIFGGKGEGSIALEIERHIFNISTEISDGEKSSKLFNLAGKTTLRQLINLISQCDALITNDSGPMHISYAVGTPLVAIFGSTSPELTGPPLEGNTIIKSDLTCSPCFRRTCLFDRVKCMEGITTEDVYNGLMEILPKNKAVFFDRDGTLCKEAHYLSNWDDFKLFPDITILKRLKEKGFLLIGISNQSGIGRGIIEESFVKDVNKLFLEKYYFDDFFYCPHHPDDNCTCRKPHLSMLFKAKTKYLVNLRASFVVGDKDSDMLLAKSAGAKGILVKTGKQKESVFADYVANDLRSVVDYIVKSQ